MTTSNTPARPIPPSATWLLDIPSFLDKDAIDLLYDGLVRPLHTNDNILISASTEYVGDFQSVLTMHGKAGGGALASALVGGEIGAQLQASGSTKSAKGRNVTLRLATVDTPVRRLEQIALAYQLQYPDRIAEGTIDWGQLQYRASPKLFAALELPPGTKIIPVAAEFADGAVVKLYPKVIAPAPQPEYPKEPRAGDQALHQYWLKFSEAFSATKATEIIEEAQVGHGKISWIDYRIEMNGIFVHVHVAPQGRYDTGVFAYNFVKRGYKHGMRLVGVLRSEPDLHVLAIYEL